ncbi:PAS domain-containing protein [Rhodoferax sp.]|uniref:PAS domain-containing protein n=1 Tax=Rhodoferax sp. TaxID=50421 RepID=UPI001813F50D|nr:PAS domain-containing protein [Rhodoferax sp.]MBA3057269.1 PAS domain S-box protein [Rhodoferax sp.]
MPLDPDSPPAAAAPSTKAIPRQGDEPSQPTLQAMIHTLRVHQNDLKIQNEELRRTKLELAASQTTYFDFYDLAPVGYCTVSAGGLILQANLTTAAMLGLPRSELLRQPITRFICAPDQDRYYLLTQQMALGGAPQEAELRLRKRDGTAFWVLIRAVAAQGDGEAVWRLVLSDISLRKQADATLRVSHHALKAVSQGVMITTPDQRVVSVNDAFVAITGYREAEILGLNCRFLQGPLTDPQAVDAMRQALTKQVEFSGELLNYRKDGSTFCNELSISPVRDEYGQLTHFIGVSRDSSQRNRAEEAMRIAAIAFECQDALVVMDACRRVLRVNQAFTRITGYSQQEAQGQTPELLRPEGSHSTAFYDAVWRDIHSTGTWHGEMWQRRKNGAVYPARVSTTVVTDARGRVTHYVASLTDSTDSALQERQREQAEAAQRAALVREVHHHVKNSLQGISGLLHQSARQHPALAEPLQQAISQVQGIAVIHGLQGRADSAQVRVCELTGAIADAVAGLWQTPVLVEIPPGWQPCLVVEKEAVPLALVLNELIVNAVKHGGQTPVRIDVRKGERPDQVQISISNAGQFTQAATSTEQAHGLKLVAALLPRQGARLLREQQDGRVITCLHLEPPTLGPDLRILT